MMVLMRRNVRSPWRRPIAASVPRAARDASRENARCRDRLPRRKCQRRETRVPDRQGAGASMEAIASRQLSGSVAFVPLS